MIRGQSGDGKMFYTKYYDKSKKNVYNTQKFDIKINKREKKLQLDIIIIIIL